MTLSARQGLAASLGLGSPALCCPRGIAVLSLPGAASRLDSSGVGAGRDVDLWTIALEMPPRLCDPRLMLGLPSGGARRTAVRDAGVLLRRPEEQSRRRCRAVVSMGARSDRRWPCCSPTASCSGWACAKGASWIRGLLGEALALLAALPAVLVVSYLMPGAMPPQHESAQARRVVVALVLDELDTSAIDADIANLPNAAIRARGRSAPRACTLGQLHLGVAARNDRRRELRAGDLLST